MTFYKFSKKITHSVTHSQGDLYYPLVADKNFILKFLYKRNKIAGKKRLLFQIGITSSKVVFIFVQKMVP